MRKFLSFALMIFASFLIAGCGADNADNEESYEESYETRIGTIKYMNVAEDALLNSDEQVYFENMSTMIAALQAEKIDEMRTYECVANYLAERNPEFEYSFPSPVRTDFFCCAIREKDADLKREFDTAISQLTKNGVLADLVKDYIADSNLILTSPGISLPTFYGEPTIKIGVTGDLPMMDYIRPDNVPAGFNVALLAEISKIIEKNFMLVQVDSGARAAMLFSGKVDVIFWAVAPNDKNDLEPNLDKPDGMILTAPYFSDEIVHVRLKK